VINLKNKNAVVTGGTRGIGKAISLDLAEHGANVYALYARDRENAEALEELADQRGFNIVTVRGDLTKDEAFRASVDFVGQACETIDILVHAAASGVFRRAMELTDKHMRWTFDLNFFAVHKLTLALVGKMGKGGRIIGITSAGGTRAVPYYAAIGASKGALEALFRHYAKELAEEGIIVNLVCPGMVKTDMTRVFPEIEELLAKTLEYTPTGELTTPDQVASLVSYLCSEQASQITGQTLVMDGGKGLLA
jgi:enoyl-[acyl-carrier protein] reductase III